MILVIMNLFTGNKLVLLFNLLVFAILLSRSESGQIRCMEKERQALLLFKEGLKDDHDILSSWRTDDCCEWMGVKCSNYTSHVIALDLNQEQQGYPPLLQGNIGPSLLELQHLVYLDLSFVDFSGSTIPKFIGSLNKLKHLNLAYTSFAGVIPDQFRNLSNLQSLDLSWNRDLSVRNLEWLSQLSSLRRLNLPWVNLSKAYDWSEAIRRLPFLTELQLTVCQLPITATTLFPLFNSSSMSLSILELSFNHIGIDLSRFHGLFNYSSLIRVGLSSTRLFGRIPEDFGQMKSLEYLYLGGNKLEGEITNSIGNLSNFRELDLSGNQLNGSIPPSLGKLRQLQFLDLSSNRIQGEMPDFLPSLPLIVLHLRNNELNGTIPRSFGKLQQLQFLDLSANRFRGEIPPSIGSLSELEELDLSSNCFKGLVSEVHLRNLSKLKILNIANNSLVLKFNSDWVLPANLSIIILANCKIGPHFPSWLRSQKFIVQIDISVNAISDTIPNWFWDLSAEFVYLNMSQNSIHGILPDLSMKFGNCESLDLSSNNFEGPIPLLPPNVLFLYLSRNRFLGSPSSLCNTSGLLGHVDVSNNLLSGRLPDCWGKFEQLFLLNIANNNFSGSIPTSIGQLQRIQSLHLRNNSLEGELPSSLQQCANLSTIDLGNNVLTGKIPMWLGKSFRNLVVLSLGSNRFYGSIPPEICHLTMIRILDLSQNSISGAIPKCIEKFNAMALKGSFNPRITLPGIVTRKRNLTMALMYAEKALLVWKGRELEYENTLGLVKSIDLSSNELTGEIPFEITYLEGLVALNLSRNNLNGKIPPEIGHLQLLESLDLSRNHLSGMIPAGLSQLNFVGVLDLSNNNLTGKIPSSTQLQSFNVSSYWGNPGLCGHPLPNLCSEDYVNLVLGASQDSKVQKDDEFINSGFYAALGFGFAVGLCGTLGSLLLVSSWRVAYFKLVANLLDSLYVTIVVNIWSN